MCPNESNELAGHSDFSTKENDPSHVNNADGALTSPFRLKMILNYLIDSVFKSTCKKIEVM